MTAATESKLKLPSVLADLDLKLARALAAPLRELWPEDEKYEEAEQPAELAKILIRTSLHERLVNAKIRYLFRPDITARGESKLTVSVKASSRLAFLTGLDFLCEFSHAQWLTLTPEQRIACVDHALCACERDPDSGAYSVRLPDVAEFSGVVQRWGLWTPPLRGFGVAIEHAQIELFVPQLSETAARDEAEAQRARVKKGGR